MWLLMCPYVSMREAGGLVPLVARHCLSASCELGRLPRAGEAHSASLPGSRCLMPTMLSPGKAGERGVARGGGRWRGRSGKASLRR